MEREAVIPISVQLVNTTSENTSQLGQACLKFGPDIQCGPQKSTLYKWPMGLLIKRIWVCTKVCNTILFT